MALGPGKYGARAALLLAEVNANLCLVVTMGGDAGDAFDVATADPALLLKLPGVLRDVAASIERDLGADAALRDVLRPKGKGN
ncbi:MAG: hypothetical protein EHM24_19685 [Acidobacteria bacterium]|nr:MAG: hypothetical protein EHM24_19685 [Acidobacteriota bacterium]